MTTKYEEFVTEDAIVESISKEEKLEMSNEVTYLAEKYPVQPE